MNMIEKLTVFLRVNRTNIIVVLIFLTYTLVSFGFYQARTLNGDINNHILSGEMFGVPANLKERGIKPLYYGPGQTGWDGQFYYYMSNDILALKDTANHIDAPSYRYQRVGLSLYAATVAKILGMDWVSPTTYFISYLLLILAATWSGAQLFSKVGVHPSLILLWSLSIGTQITLFNALPDAAADAFLILALSALYAKRYALSAIPFALSALSREAYVLFPSFVLLFILINLISDFRTSKYGGLKNLVSHLLKCKSYYLLALPGVIAIIWHIYVVRHFGVSPSQQAHGILGYPLVAWKDYFLSGINGNHKLVGTGMVASLEASSLLLFLVILAVALWISTSMLVKRFALASPEMCGLAFASIIFVFLYACFGPTVIMHYSGYFKAAAVFFFLIPLLLSVIDLNKKIKVFIYLLLIAALSFTSFYNMKVRILPFTTSNDQYTKMSTVTETQRIECFGKYDAKIRVNSIEMISGDVLSSLFGLGDLIVVSLELLNTGEHAFISTRNFGSVYMSYHWVNSNGKVLKDGIRSAIPGILLPGQSTQVQIISDIPKKLGEEISLILSPVQEGCAWFYIENPKVSESLKLTSKY